MAVLKLNCFCDEVQMNRIVWHVTDCLCSGDMDSLSDIDEEVSGVRVCVDFEVFMDVVKIKSAEILDEDWELLYEDSAVLTSRLNKVLEAYNRENKEALRRAKQIRSDQLIGY